MTYFFVNILNIKAKCREYLSREHCLKPLLSRTYRQFVTPPLAVTFIEMTSGIGFWFEHFRQLLEGEEITFLSRSEQFDLLNRVKQVQQEVNTLDFGQINI